MEPKQTTQLAGRIREVILDGRWIANTNCVDQLENLDWQLATSKAGSLNTIAALTFHIDYYLAGMVRVLEGGPLDIRDKYSFDMPPVRSEEDWEKLREKLFADGARFADLVEQMPEERLQEAFVDQMYGSWQRNIEAMIEHSYYHLGQIVLISKLLRDKFL
ncbi:MAG: DinB family protein [Saprospiraceae bacterium]